MGPRTIGFALLLALLPIALPAQGVRTWYGNEVFMHELESSIKLFFGNRIGTYVRSDNFAFTLAPMDATNHDERMLIATEFLAVFGQGAPGMRQLDNNRVLYDYSAFKQGMVRAAIVTPKYGTTVLAAAITHWSCGAIAPASVHDAAAVRFNYESAACRQPTLTIFFENKRDMDAVIRKELVKWGAKPFLRSCTDGDLHSPNTGALNAHVAKRGWPPPRCRVRIEVVTFNWQAR